MVKSDKNTNKKALKGAPWHCYRFMQTCLQDSKVISELLKKYTGNVSLKLARLSMTVCMCNNMVGSCFNPVVLDLFLRDVGFQGWSLVLFELLALLKFKVEHAVLHNTLEMVLKGKRLRVFFDRLEEMISAHLDNLRPVLKALDFEFLELEKEQGREIYVREVEAFLQKNDGVLKVDHLIEDEEGCEWWIEQFGRTTYAVKWSKFEATLRCHKDPRIVQLLTGSDEIIQLLKETISPQHKRKAVTAFQWGEFLISFGPGIRVALVQMIASARSAPWFAGALTHDEARSILTPYPCGTFLVRFSESAVCCWAVSYANEQTGQINHALVKAQSVGPYSLAESDHFVCGKKSFKSLSDLVKQNPQLRFPAPMKNLGPSRCFRDFLSFEEAQDMLEGKPVGTFLFRFSQSQEACLVVAYVTATKGILQSKIFCDPAAGFILGGKAYKRISDMISQNKDKLQFPLQFNAPGCDNASEDDFYEDDECVFQQQRIRTGGNDSVYGSFEQPSGGMMSNTYLPLGENIMSSAVSYGYGPVADYANVNYGAVPDNNEEDVHRDGADVYGSIP